MQCNPFGLYTMFMPRKNTIRRDVEGGFYHIYNRGVDKRVIFQDSTDYSVFMRFIKEYLLPPNHPDLEILQGLNPRRHAMNYNHLVELIAFCLMPNHFHLFIRQIKKTGVSEFMRALATNYSVYFNHKYDREGPLFQGTYKAVLVDENPYFLWITKYIHQNPREIIARVKPLQKLAEYSYSSYPDYLGLKKTEWVKSDIISENFGNSQNNRAVKYQQFIEETDDEDESTDLSTYLLDGE